MINTKQLPILIKDLASDEVRFTSSLAKVLLGLSNEPTSLQSLLDCESSLIPYGQYNIAKHGLDNGKYCPDFRPYNDINIASLLRATDLTISLLDCSYKNIKLFDDREVHHPVFTNQSSDWELRKLDYLRHKQKIQEIYLTDTPLIYCLDIKKYFESIGLAAIDSIMSFSVLQVPDSLKEDFRQFFPYLPQGLPLGYTFANIIARCGLSQVDFCLANAKFSFTRFQDDIVIGCKDQADVNLARELITSQLPYGIEINFEKTYVYTGRRRKYIGMGIQPGAYPLEDREFEFDDIIGLESATDDASSALDWSNPVMGTSAALDYHRIFHELNEVGGPVPSASLEKANLRGLENEEVLQSVSLNLAIARPYLTPILKRVDAFEPKVLEGPSLIQSIPDSPCKESHRLDAVDVLSNPKIKPTALRKISLEGRIDFRSPIARRRCSDILMKGDSYCELNFTPTEFSTLAEEAGAIQHNLAFGEVSVRAKDRLPLKGRLILEALSSG